MNPRTTQSYGHGLRLIRAFAESTAPMPMPPPGQATELTVTLTLADGALLLRWKVGSARVGMASARVPPNHARPT